MKMVSKRKVERIILTERQEKILRKYANKRDVSIQDKGRIDIILLDSEGKSYKAITRILNRKYNTVKKWCIRWQEHSSELLSYEKSESSDYKLLNRMLLLISDKPRPGAIPKFSMEQKKEIVALACMKPEDLGYPITQWNRELLTKVVIEKGIVKNISSRYVSMILKKSGH